MESKIYKVKKTTCHLESNSDSVNDSIWKIATLIKYFSQPWDKEKQQKTNFRALYGSKFLYLRYDIKDDNVLIYDKNDNKLDVAQSDRVEIFFRKDKNLNEYFCLEIDPTGKVLDYSAIFYRKFDYDWAWPRGHLLTKGVCLLDGYRVEVAVSLSSLCDLGVLKGNIIEAGIYRGNCIKLPNEKEKEANIKWISWVDPKTEEPDFHVPSSFGILNLIS